MKGHIHVTVTNRRIRYDFTIHRNITIIQGDSATGKTTLLSMINDYYNLGESSGVTLSCEKPCVTLSGRNWQPLLATIRDSLVFIDEGNEFVNSEDFAKAIRGTDNYYIIVTREALHQLPYSVLRTPGIREIRTAETDLQRNVSALWSKKLRERNFTVCPDYGG